MPDLIEMYLWLHHALAHLITYERAINISIGQVFELAAEGHSREMGKHLTSLYDRVKGIVPNYSHLSPFIHTSQLFPNLSMQTNTISMLSWSVEQWELGHVLHANRVIKSTPLQMTCLSCTSSQVCVYRCIYLPMCFSIVAKYDITWSYLLLVYYMNSFSYCRSSILLLLSHFQIQRLRKRVMTGCT